MLTIKGRMKKRSHQSKKMIKGGDTQKGDKIKLVVNGFNQNREEEKNENYRKTIRFGDETVTGDLKECSFNKREEIKPKLQELKGVGAEVQAIGLDHSYEILKDSF